MRMTFQKNTLNNGLSSQERNGKEGKKIERINSFVYLPVTMKQALVQPKNLKKKERKYSITTR